MLNSIKDLFKTELGKLGYEFDSNQNVNDYFFYWHV